MKKKLFIYFSFIILFCIIGNYAYLSTDSNTPEAIHASVEATKNDCKEYLNFSDNQREQFDLKYINLYTIEKCDYIVNSNDKSNSFFLIFESMINSSIFQFIFPFFIPILLLYPIILKLSAELRSNYPKYFFLRKTYNQYIFHLFKKSYKYIFVILFILCYLIIYSAVKSNFNFNPRYDIAMGFISSDSMMFYNNSINYVIYFVVIILNLFSYINIALIILRQNNKNFLITYIESFLAIYLWWCITFIVIGKITTKMFNVSNESINILEIYTWNGITDANIFLIVNIIFYVFTLIVTLLAYKNKEKFIIKCEG